MELMKKESEKETIRISRIRRQYVGSIGGTYFFKRLNPRYWPFYACLLDTTTVNISLTLKKMGFFYL